MATCHVIGYGPRRAPNIVNAEHTISTLAQLTDILANIPGEDNIFLCSKDSRYPDYYMERLRGLNAPVAGCGGLKLFYDREKLLEQEFIALTSENMVESSVMKYSIGHPTASGPVQILDISHGILFRRDTIAADLKIYLSLTENIWDGLRLSNYWARRQVNMMNLCVPEMNKFFMEAMRMVKVQPVTIQTLNEQLRGLEALNMLAIKIDGP